MTRLVFISFLIVQVAQAWKLLLERDVPPDPRDDFTFYFYESHDHVRGGNNLSLASHGHTSQPVSWVRFPVKLSRRGYNCLTGGARVALQ